MKRLSLRPLPSLLAVLTLTLYTRPAAALSCDDIMNMVNMNVPADVVATTMKASGDSYAPDVIDCLKRGGAPAEVLAQAQRQAAVTETARPVSQPTTTTTPTNPSTMSTDDDLGSRRITRTPTGKTDVDLSEGPSTSGAPAEIEDAINEYQAKKYLASSLRLYQALESGNYPQAAADIYYYLGRNLEALGMYHSAQFHYAVVAKDYVDSQYFEYTLPRLVAIAEYTGDDTELAGLVSRGTVSPDRAPRQARDMLYFLDGVARFKKEDLSGARASFSQVDANTVLGLKAKYFEGVINNQQGKLKSAVRAFRDIGRAQVDPRTEYEAQELRRLRDLAILNEARVYYGIEDYKNASAHYELVPRDSQYWGVSVFEHAWANFLLNDLNKTLGLLLTARSPFFRRDMYEPEATILRALTYFNLCEYKEVERLLIAFEDQHRPQYDEMLAFVEAYSSKEGRKVADEAWDTYFGREKRDTVLPKALFNRILQNQDLVGVVRHLKVMEDERVVIDAQKDLWRNTMAPYLKQNLDADTQRLKRRAGLLLLSEMANQANYLSDKLTQSEIIRFEVVDAQRVDYSYKASNVSLTDSGANMDLDFATAVDFIYWPFNGEYWADELGYYQYTEASSCK